MRLVDIFILADAIRGSQKAPQTASTKKTGMYLSDVTAKARPAPRRWPSGVCVGDYATTGCEDLFINYWGENVLTTTTATVLLRRHQEGGVGINDLHGGWRTWVTTIATANSTFRIHYVGSIPAHAETGEKKTAVQECR